MSRPKNTTSTHAAQVAVTRRLSYHTFITGHMAFAVNEGVPVEEAMNLAGTLLDGTHSIMQRLMDSDDGEGAAYTHELAALAALVNAAGALQTSCYRALFIGAGDAAEQVEP